MLAPCFDLLFLCICVKLAQRLDGEDIALERIGEPESDEEDYDDDDMEPEEGGEDELEEELEMEEPEKAVLMEDFGPDDEDTGAGHGK